MSLSAQKTIEERNLEEIIKVGLENAKKLGSEFKELCKQRQYEKAFELKKKEIKLLEETCEKLPKNYSKRGVIICPIGEAYSSLAKVAYKCGFDKDIEYFKNARDAFKEALDNKQFLANHYDTYTFVLEILYKSAETPEEKLNYAREKVIVLVSAASRENVVIRMQNKSLSPLEILPAAIQRVTRLEKILKYRKAKRPK